MGGFYILIGSVLEKCGKIWKNGCFSGRIWPDWGNAARADLAGLGSIGLSKVTILKCCLQCPVPKRSLVL